MHFQTSQEGSDNRTNRCGRVERQPKAFAMYNCCKNAHSECPRPSLYTNPATSCFCSHVRGWPVRGSTALQSLRVDRFPTLGALYDSVPRSSLTLRSMTAAVLRSAKTRSCISADMPNPVPKRASPCVDCRWSATTNNKHVSALVRDRLMVLLGEPGRHERWTNTSGLLNFQEENSSSTACFACV